MTRRFAGILAVLVVLGAILTFSTPAYAVTYSWTNATTLSDNSTLLPTDEGNLITEVYWREVGAADNTYKLAGTVSQPPPFPITGTLYKTGYPVGEGKTIEWTARHLLGTRGAGEFAPSVTKRFFFLVPAAPTGLVVK